MKLLFHWITLQRRFQTHVDLNRTVRWKSPEHGRSKKWPKRRALCESCLGTERLGPCAVNWIPSKMRPKRFKNIYGRKSLTPLSPKWATAESKSSKHAHVDSVIMSGLSTLFTSVLEDLTCPSECRKSYVLTKLDEKPRKDSKTTTVPHSIWW